MGPPRNHQMGAVVSRQRPPLNMVGGLLRRKALAIGVAEADFQAVAHPVAGALGHRLFTWCCSSAFAWFLCSTRARCITLMCIRLRPRRDAALPSCELLMCSAECSGGTASRCTRSACMQANTANEHSQMLAQVPANACSDSESRKCSLVLLLVPYITLVWDSQPRKTGS